MGISLSIQGFQKQSVKPMRWERGRCILDMKDFIKEMVNASIPLMGFYADLIPTFFCRWNSREE